MDERSLPWLSLEGVSRSTMIFVIIVIVVLVILLIIRAIMVRRKAAEASSRSAESSDYREIKRTNRKRKDQGNRREEGHFETRVAAPTIESKSLQNPPVQDKVTVSRAMTVDPVKVEVQPPIVNTPVVQFQQGPAVQAEHIIDTQKMTFNLPQAEKCFGGNCGAQLEATPQLVQAQQNIHQPNKEIPAYPQRHPRMQARTFPNRTPPTRQVVQQPIPAEEPQEEQPEESQEEEQIEVEAAPRSNYRLIRGRAE